MPTDTSDQQITIPIGVDPADNPVAFVNSTADVEPRLVRTYTSEADRAARMTSLAENNISGLADVDRVEVWSGTTHLSLHTRALYADKFRTADAAAINNSVALVPDNTLFAALPAAGRFHWTLTLFYDGSAAGDFKVAHTIPAGATMRWGGIGAATAVAAGVGTGQFLATTVSGTAIPYGASGVGTANTMTVLIHGTVVMGGTAGNLQVLYAQQAADPTNLIVREHSRLQVWRVV